MSGYTKKEVEGIVADAVDKKVKEYFRMSRPGFEIASNFDSKSHGLSEFSLTTDEQQGIDFYKQGHCKVISNTSLEILSGYDQKNTHLGVGIHAENGHIYIRALHGNLYLQGKEVIIDSTKDDGQVSILSKKTILQKAPNIKIDGETTTILGTMDLQCIGGHTSIYSHMSDVEISDGSELEIGPGTVLQFIDKVKKMAALFS